MIAPVDPSAALRRMQMIVTSYFTHKIEGDEALGLIIVQLEKAGFGSIGGIAYEPAEEELANVTANENA